MRLSSTIRPLIAGVALLTGASGCRKHPETHTDPTVVVMMDDSVLSLEMLHTRLPGGLPEEDSLRLARAVIEGWLEDRLYETYLSPTPDDEIRIERMVDDYRRKLRMESYRRRMRRRHEPPVKPDSIRAYYAAHSHELITEKPLVKGLYMRVPAKSPELAELKQRVFSATAADVKAIGEKGTATDFESQYFGDSWIEFDAITAEIPYRFGNADEFVSNTVNFETEANGNVYLLHIYSSLPSGSRMPYEFAETQIRDILQESRLEAYRRGLLKALREKAIKEGRLVFGEAAGKGEAASKGEATANFRNFRKTD